MTPVGSKPGGKIYILADGNLIRNCQLDDDLSAAADLLRGAGDDCRAACGFQLYVQNGACCRRLIVHRNRHRLTVNYNRW